MTQIICGVDVGSERLAAQIGRAGAVGTFANTSEGIAALAAFCAAHAVSLVAMEATGGYERRALGELWAAGLPVALANPRSVRRFAEGMGVIEKTDAIDRGMIAWYAEVKQLKPTPPASATLRRLQAMVTRLRQLTETRVAQLNQRRLVVEAEVSEGFEALIAVITGQMRGLETKIAETIAEDPLWKALDQSFRTIKGVADRTVARLMAEMPEIGTLSNKAVAKIAGLAPIANDSGKRHGRRPIRGGREGVRSILFVVAEIVRRHDPDFKAFHQKLCDAGKPRKVVRVAIARKLLVRLNAKAREIRCPKQSPA